MVRVLEHGDAGAAGVLAGDLDAVLDGLRTRVDQHRLLGEVSGGVRGEQFGDPHVLLVGRDREERVHDVAELTLRGGDDRVVRVTDRGDPDAGTQIDELVAVDVDEDGAVGALDEHRKSRRDAARDDREPTLLEGLRLRTGNRGHDPPFLGHRG